MGINMFKCPYCSISKFKNNKEFTSWKDVRQHTISCSGSTKKYIVCLHYGPISFDTINSYNSLASLKVDYPNISFHNTYWGKLRKKKLTTIKQSIWTKELIIESIQNFYKESNKIPQGRDFRGNLNYPNASTVERHFGSWNKAIQASGFIPNLNDTYGIPTKAKDGVTYRSQAEAYFVDNFLFEKHKYQYEVPYGNGWLYDFYLSDQDLYIELTAGLDPEKIENKVIYNNRIKRNFKLIKVSEIYKRKGIECLLSQLS
jgi:hypothetical protein